MCPGIVVHVTTEVRRDAAQPSVENSTKGKGAKAAGGVAALYP